MTPDGPADRWRLVADLIGEALERDAAERNDYLDAACDGDPALRRELESLLAAHERSGPVDRLAADLSPLTARLREPAARALTGRTIGRYRVLARVASGGMGVVYRAMDERLGRAVALKFLHPRLDADDSAAARFRLEARAVAALEHPNICTVHEIGETDDGQIFLAMPMYDGETLQRRIARGAMPTAEAVGIALQVARGLAKAHARGIVHRDVKPSNLLLTDDGVVKILDFGVAKLTDVTLTDAAAGPLGTVAYMSPEQVAGARVDARTDVWSLGVVLYEMLAGRRPFEGSAGPALAVAIQGAEPAPLAGLRADVPPALERVVARALAKAPDARHQSAQAFERDLQALGLVAEPPESRAPAAASRAWLRGTRAVATIVVVSIVAAVVALVPGPLRGWRAAAAPPERSIVVRPFALASGDAGSEYLGDALAEEIISRLTSVPELRVISLSSAARYRGATASARTIAGELGVALVLEGEVRRSGGRLRIGARLVDGRAGTQRWKASYDVEPANLALVHQAITREVLRALEVELGDRERTVLARQGTGDPVAYDYYRRGRYLWSTRTAEGHDRAIAYFERAIARDSGYADAYAGLADVHLTSYMRRFAGRSEAESYARLKWAAERALALDEQSADAHRAFAISLWWQRNWPGAERELRRAIQLNPGNATARSWYSLLLGGMGRSAEAVTQSRMAAELDPFATVIRDTYAWQCYLARDHGCAMEQLQRTLEIDPNWPPAHLHLALVYAQRRMHAEAIAAASRLVELWSRNTEALGVLAYAYAVAGRPADARRLLPRAKAQARDDFGEASIARAHAALGEADSAFAWLARTQWVWPNRAVRGDPAFDRVRGDPRFARLVERVDREMGLR